MVIFLHKHGTEINIANKNGCTPLYLVLYNGHLEVVKFLYEHGADADVYVAIKNS
jgi:ankyrin repeat protein